jgi:20S proteasome subunit alpha 3
LYTYQAPIPVEHLVSQICDVKQGYTQFGGPCTFTCFFDFSIGQRPFGVSFLFAGYDDEHGFQLYQTAPSGNYGGWKATAIGEGHGPAQVRICSTKKVQRSFFFFLALIDVSLSSKGILKSDYKEDLTLEQAFHLGLKVLSKTMDSTRPTPDKRKQKTSKITN